MNEAEPDTREFYFYIADEYSWNTYDINKMLDEWSSEYSVLNDLLVSINSLNAIPFGSCAFLPVNE